MYGSEGSGQDNTTGNTGKLSGQGSHFGADQQAAGVGADSSAPSTTMTHGAAGQTGNTATNPSGTPGTGLGQNTNTGTTTNPAANTAANRAAGTYGQDTSGAFPSERENPYKTSNLDPRVDSQPRGTTTQPTSSQPGTRQDYSGPRETGNYGGNAGALPEHEKSNRGRDAGLAAGAGTGAAALGAHEHDKHTQSSTGTSTTGTTNTYDNQRSTNAGPHDSNLANKADPRVDSDRDGRIGPERTGNTTGTGNSTSTGTVNNDPNTSGTNTTGQDSSNKPSIFGRAAAAVGAGGANRDREGENTSGNTTSGTTGQDTTTTTSGGAKNDYHNTYQAPPGAEARDHGKDPSSNVNPTHGSTRAPSFLGNLTGEDATGLEGSSGQPTQEGTGRHHGAETAAGGAGAAGIAEHEANKHHHGTTGGPGYDSGISQARGGTHPSLTDRTAGNTTGYDQPASSTGTTQPREHHGARDAELAGGAGAGLGGAAYEAERHHNQSGRQTGATGGLDQPTSTSGAGYNQSTSGAGYNQPSSTTGAGYNQPTSGTGYGSGYDQPSSTLGNTQDNTRHGDSHLGRDAAVAGVAGAGLGGVAAHESGRHHQTQPDAHTITTTGPTSSGAGGNYDNQRIEPTSTSGYGQPSSTTSGTTQSHEHHGARDAALGGAAGAGVGGAAYEAERHHHQGTHDPTQPRQPIQPTQPKAPTEPHEPYGATHHDQHHLGRDAAVGTAAVGGTGVHGHEESKEFTKEQKAHDKTLAKEEKHHDKALAKEEKHHDHHHGHEEKEKKPGLIDRLLHRGKNNDDEVPEGSKHVHPESQHVHPGAYGAPAPGADVPAGTGAAGGGAYEYEKHHQHPLTTHDAGVTDPAQDRNKLYKEAPTGTGTGTGTGIGAGTGTGTGTGTGYAEKPTGGYASQVTGGTGTTALAQGEGGPRDSHLTGAGNTLDPR